VALALPAASPRLLPRSPLLPESPWGWLANVVIFGLTRATRLIPPAWSLDVELQMYVAMAILLARTRWTVAIWCLASIAYTGYLIATGTNIIFRYIPVPAASLPFSLGSALYLMRDRLPRARGGVGPAAVAAFALHTALARAVWTDAWMGGFYASLGLVVVAVAALQSLDGRAHPARAIDRFLGDLAYPLFLCHMQVIAFVRWVAPSLSVTAPGAFGAASLLTAVGLAWGLHRATEVPLVPLRRRLAGTGAAAMPPEKGRALHAGWTTQ
jgi:peptidoglycan/LPS O-acetylase OafA/YrhL